MPRIVAGVARGRRLAVPPGGTRPTSDRAREALFSTVAGLIDLDGARVLDLYAGSGALGLEALSRGAAEAVFVEADARTAQVIRRNLETVALPGGRLVVDRVLHVVSRPAHSAFDLVLADPPYAAGRSEVTDMIEGLVRNGWLAAGAVVVIERSSRDAALDWPEGIKPVKTRRYGEGTLWYGRAS